MKIHAGIMEVAIASLFDYRKNYIVPNVSWGWGLRHEADMIVVSPELKATEVEIKVTISDLKADFMKPHGHHDKKIGRMFYAIPESILEKSMELIPVDCGIIVVSSNETNGVQHHSARFYRNCKHRKDYKGITIDELLKLLDLGCMRIWTLKRKNNTP